MNASMIGMIQFETNPVDSIVDKESVVKLSDDADTGYILEVDLEYPQDVHDAHSDYPLAPEKRAIPFEWLSSHQLSPSLNEKLLPNLKDKSN